MVHQSDRDNPGQERQGRVSRAWQSIGRRLGRPSRTAFVLSGGGNLGAVQVGMLRALVEAGIKPDVIVGCSVGAINGAGFAADPTLNGVQRLERIWNRLAEGDPDIMPSPRIMPLIAQVARKGESLHDQDVLRRMVAEELDADRFEDLNVPFTCVATELESASEYWFDEGPLVPAVMASAALPAVYAPVMHRGRAFVDGGVLREMHAHRAVELGATELYLLHVGHLSDRAGVIQRPFDAAVQAYWTARSFRLQDDLERIPAHCTVHFLPAGSKPRLRFDDFTQAAELSRMAHEATSMYLSTGLTPAPASGPASADEGEPGNGVELDAEGDDQVERDVLDALRESVRYPQAATHLLSAYRSSRKGSDDVEH